MGWIKRLAATVLLATIMSIPTTSFAESKITIYESDWQTVEYPANFTLSFDRGSTKKNVKTGIISIRAEKKYNEKDVHDGEFVSVVSSIDYNPADQTYWVRSLNYDRKNERTLIDAVLIYQPDWKPLEQGSYEAALCKAALDYVNQMENVKNQDAPDASVHSHNEMSS